MEVLRGSLCKEWKTRWGAVVSVRVSTASRGRWQLIPKQSNKQSSTKQSNKQPRHWQTVNSCLTPVGNDVCPWIPMSVNTDIRFRDNIRRVHRLVQLQWSRA